jgi:hypothetical protein
VIIAYAATGVLGASRALIVALLRNFNIDAPRDTGSLFVAGLRTGDPR